MEVWTFFSAAPTAQNSPELKIHIRNVAQDTSVYYSVAKACRGTASISSTTSWKNFPLAYLAFNHPYYDFVCIKHGFFPLIITDAMRLENVYTCM